MNLIDHLTELRKRLIWSFFYLILVFILCFIFADRLFAFLAKPLVKLMDQNIEECLALKTLLKHFFPNSKTIISNEKIDISNINDVVFSDLDEKTIDFFSIDIDGNDYWVLKNMVLKRVNVICCEYNHWVGNNVKKVMPYNSEHQFKNDVFFGASLLAMYDLLHSKGFDLVAVDSSGTNAFFVKKEFAKYFEILSPIKSWRSVVRFHSESQAKEMRESVKKFKFVEL